MWLVRTLFHTIAGLNSIQPLHNVRTLFHTIAGFKLYVNIQVDWSGRPLKCNTQRVCICVLFLL